MRRFAKALGRGLIVLALLLGTVWIFAPAEPVDRKIEFRADQIGADVDAYLAKGEAAFPDITPGVEKRMVWAGVPGQKTALSIVYIHGFSATSEEIRPVPDDVAKALGANLFFTRLTGHGLTGEALANARAGDWLEDMAEAMDIGRRTGERVLVISTSTGATVAALAAADPELSKGLAGLVMISPNFGIRNPAAQLLDMPLARWWGPLVAGAERSFAPANADHGKYWTTSYPTTALFPMAALIRAARSEDYTKASVPALFIYSESDQVIDPTVIPQIAEAWAGPVTENIRTMGPGDDPYAHVIAGDILSPGQTTETVAAIVDWAGGL